MENPSIGFIGLGNMGSPMVERLLAAKFEVSVWGRSAAKLAPWKERGLRIAGSAKDLACHCDVHEVARHPSEWRPYWRGEWHTNWHGRWQ